jgi:RNA polymerase sigma factor (sigma-70 family)
MRNSDRILSDADVLELLADPRTDREPIRFLYETHFESLSSFIIHNSGDYDDAQDIFQEVLVAFIQLVRTNKFRGEASIKTFLFSLNRNIWYNELKRRKRAIDRNKNYDRLSRSDEEVVDRVIENREANQEILKLLESLGENCKKVLLLYYYENRSMKEILSELDYENEQIVRNKKYKCMKKLEQMIEADGNLFQHLKTLLHG